MKPAVVVDVGNTRIKWGRCALDRVTDMTSLAHDDDAEWRRQMTTWQITPGSIWAVSGVQPKQRDRLCDWLAGAGQKTVVINSHLQLPLRIDVEFPEKVGLDRLLNAVAVNTERSAEAGAFIVDAGTAVTVDYVDASGTFQGGAIFPGLRLMAKSLHDHTALLPVIDDFRATTFPAKNTEDALRSGIVQAVVGGIERLAPPLSWSLVFVSGGDAALIAPHLTSRPMRVWPEMTLEGIRRSVQ
ncbi:MAG: type III pantothenate kinase [Gemmataceae bacterium]|nr:type III pantothenate kinase [Gemmataceae bacterium]